MRGPVLSLPALCLLTACILALPGCAAQTASGPGVTVWDAGVRRVVPASAFDEQDYLGRGFYRANGPDGKPLYVRIPKTDVPKDVTFITGNDTGKERSFGGLGGYFTGKPQP